MTACIQGMTDEIAITTQGQQNLMFAVNSMNATDRTQMSDTKDELILKCSFNQRDCDMEKLDAHQKLIYSKRDIFQRFQTVHRSDLWQLLHVQLESHTDYNGASCRSQLR